MLNRRISPKSDKSVTIFCFIGDYNENRSGKKENFDNSGDTYSDGNLVDKRRRGGCIQTQKIAADIFGRPVGQKDSNILRLRMGDGVYGQNS